MERAKVAAREGAVAMGSPLEAADWVMAAIRAVVVRVRAATASAAVGVTAMPAAADQEEVSQAREEVAASARGRGKAVGTAAQSGPREADGVAEAVDVEAAVGWERVAVVDQAEVLGEAVVE